MSRKTSRKRTLRPVPIDNYLKKQLAILADLAPGTCVDSHISHDDWCGFFRGQRCNCDPDIVVVPLTDVPG